MIQTDKEVVEQLKLLRADEKPLPEDVRFSELIWAKVADHSCQTFNLKPIYAVIGLSMIFILILWFQFYGQMMFSRGDSRIAPTSEIPVVGAVLEIGPDSTLTPSPLPEGEGRVRETKSIIEEGDLLATGSESRMTFFLPGVGYFHLGPNSKVQLKRARHIAAFNSGDTISIVSPDYKTGGFQYELFLEEGGLYSRLSKFESGTTLNYLTHFGTARVSGTDLLLNVEKDSGLSVEVLNGEVMVASPKEPDDYKNVKEGFGALISPNMSGTLLVTELEGPRLAELQDEFNQIFEDSEKKYARDTSNFRIVSYREMKPRKWKK